MAVKLEQWWQDWAPDLSHLPRKPMPVVRWDFRERLLTQLSDPDALALAKARRTW